MDPSQLNNKKIKMRNPRVGKLEGYQFAFTKKSNWDSKLSRASRINGKANVSENNDSMVWGVLLDLTESEVEKMDDSEGTESGHYFRKTVEVITDSGIVKAITYVAHDDKLIPNTAPLEWYLNHVLDGAKYHNLPDDYIESIQAMGQ
tara:strand:+ start:149 stop:589 length:441 start_codon:yes stop_codon:yes gene_type:complete